MTKPTDMALMTRAAEQQGVSLYLQLSNIFRSRIESGEWQVGERIPTVEELYKAYGVAGMTIRQALGLLEEEGLIERFRAKGTFVRARPHRDPWCDVKTDLSDILTPRDGSSITVLQDSMVDQLPVAIAEEGTEGSRYRLLRRIHTREDTHFLVADLYFDDTICDLIPERDLHTKTSIRMVSDLPGVTVHEVRQVLTIERADIATSQALDIPLDSPVAKMVRAAYDDSGRALVIGLGSYRSDTFRLETHLR